MHIFKIINYAILSILLCLPLSIYSQHESDIWLGGRNHIIGYHSNVLQFSGNRTPEIDTVLHPGFLGRANSSYCDSETGELILYSDGWRLYNSNYEMIPGSDSLSPTGAAKGEWKDINYWDLDFEIGSSIFNSVVILPMPGQEDVYAVVHQYVTYAPGTFTSDSLFFSKVKINSTFPEGKMLKKNQVVYDDSDEYLSHASSMAVIQHANGRDWWVFVGHDNSDNVNFEHKYHVFLLDPSGMHYHHEKVIFHEDGDWYDSFLMFPSPQGNRLACLEWRNGKTSGVVIEDPSIALFDVNRCTGKLFYDGRAEMLKGNNPYYDFRGLSFSPSGQFLYLMYFDRIVQYDVEQENWPMSGDTVAYWEQSIDDASDEVILERSLFGPSRLAPNGKIYVTAAVDLTSAMHVIHHPDRRGEACDVEQLGLDLPLVNKESVPFYVNYNLGPIDGSPCDTLGLNSTATTTLAWNNPITLFPNPVKSGGVIKIQFDKPYSGEVSMYDMTGKLIKTEWCVNTRSLHYEIPESVSGVVNLVFKTEAHQQTSKKLVVK